MFPPKPRTQSIIFRSLTVGVAVALVACTEPSAPVPSPTLGRSARTAKLASHEAPFVKASIKYREQSHAYRSNRSGSASLTARALMARDGRTTLDVSTGELDVDGAPGLIAKVQVKTMDADGTLASTSNVNGVGGPTFSTTLLRRPRLTTVQVQGNVRGIDANRTDVVTVDATVYLRPDLAVSPIQAPATITAGVPVFVSADIAEMNGDVGARADCVLLVDGVEAERAAGIWVADGDAVSCVLSHAFEAGHHELAIRADRVTPGDWNESNNAATMSVDVVTATPPSRPLPEFDNGELTFRFEQDTFWTKQQNRIVQPAYGSLDLYTTEKYIRFRWSRVNLAADAFGVRVRFPLTVTLDEWVDDELATSHEFTRTTSWPPQAFDDGWLVSAYVTYPPRQGVVPTEGMFITAHHSTRYVTYTTIYTSESDVDGEVVYYSSNVEDTHFSEGAFPLDPGSRYRIRMTVRGPGSEPDEWYFNGVPPTYPWPGAWYVVTNGPLVFDHTLDIVSTPIAQDDDRGCTIYDRDDMGGYAEYCEHYRTYGIVKTGGWSATP